MENSIKEYLGALLRSLGAPLIVWLAATGYITENQAAQLLTIIVSVVVAVVWSLGNKYVWGKKVDIALEMKAGSTREDLAKELKLK